MSEKRKLMEVNTIHKKKILAYFNGQLTSVEEKELKKWIKECSKNKSYFFKIKKELDVNDINHPLLQDSFIELKNKLYLNQQFKAIHGGRSRKLVFSFSRVAALVILVFTLGFALSYILSNNLHNESEIVWFNTNVSRGEKSQLLLPDGSKVWMNSESTISYPSNFLEGSREIILEGEAFFEVAKYEGKNFTVKTHDYNIEVLGTKFNVMAYTDFNRTETSLIEGHVQIQKGSQTVDLEPGQMLTFKNKQFSVQKTNTFHSGSWKDDKFSFDHITFSEMVVRLERWYDVDIIMKDETLNDIVYSGVFKNEETIWQVLNSIQMTLPIKYSRSGFRKFVIERE